MNPPIRNSKNIGLIKRLATNLGVDRAITYTIFSKGLQALGGVFSIFFIAFTLNESEQGYYYTFLSLIGIQLFFELGISSIIVQFVAHEAAYLSGIDDLKISGDVKFVSRISSILHFCLKYFSIIALILFLVLEFGGILFFTSFNSDPGQIQWKGSWTLMAISTSLLFIANPLLSFFEGLGKVEDVAKYRLIQQTVYLSVLVLSLLSGAKLWSLGIATSFSFAVLLIAVLNTDNRRLIAMIYLNLDIWRVNYLKEVFPYQWKIALSWISGYLIFQLFNPILFATEGPITAGKMGMTLVAINGISSISMSWIHTKIPLMSTYISKANYVELDILFNKTVSQLTRVNIFLLTLFLLFVFGVDFFNIGISQRFLDIELIFILGIASYMNQYIFAWAAYLRSHKQEPFLQNSIFTGLLTGSIIFLSAYFFGIDAVVYGYSSVILFIALPWAYYIFHKKRIEWHDK